MSRERDQWPVGERRQGNALAVAGQYLGFQACGFRGGSHRQAGRSPLQCARGRSDAAGARAAARGQQPAVADTAVVEHADLDIARERQVLQSVVADDDLGGGVPLEQRARGIGAAARLEHRRARGCRISAGSSPTSRGSLSSQHFAAVVRAPAVAARHHAHLPARARPDDCTIGHHYRCLAGAARDHVADHDHRHRDAFGLAAIPMR